MSGMVQIKGFRKVDDATIHLAKPVTLLRGPNEAGKTSILMGIEIALAGSCHGVSEHPRDLRGRDAKRATCTVHLDYKGGALSVERSFTGGSPELTVTYQKDGEVRSFPGPTTAVDDSLRSLLGMSDEQLACALNAGRFLDMSTKDQRKFLASVAGAEVTADQAIGAIPDAFFATADPSVVNAIHTGFARVQSLTGEPLLDAIHRMAYDHRTEANGAKAEAARACRWPPTVERPAEDLPDDVDARIADARRAAREAETAALRVATLRERLSEAEAALAEQRAALAPDEPPALDDASLANDVEMAVRTYNEALADLARAQVAESSASHSLVKATEDLTRFQGIEGGAVCSACGQEIPEEHVTRCVETARASVNGLQAKLDAAKAERTETEHRCQNADGTLAAARTALERARKAHQDEIDKRTQAVEKVQWLEADVEKIRAAIADQEANMPPCVDDAAAEHLISLKSYWDAYEKETRAAAEASKRLVTATAIAEQWDWIVGRFGTAPHSVRTSLLENDRLRQVETMVNGVTEGLLGKRVSFPTGDSPLEVKVIDDRHPDFGGIRPATNGYLSGAERAKLQLSLAYGFCRAMDFPLLLCDLEAALDPKAPAAILTQARAMAQAWPDLRIILTFASLSQPVATPWCATYEVVNGRTIAPLGDENPFSGFTEDEGEQGIAV